MPKLPPMSDSLHADAVDVNVQMRGQKLDGERGKRIVALVIDALVFRIPLPR